MLLCCYTFQKRGAKIRGVLLLPNLFEKDLLNKLKRFTAKGFS